MHISFSFVILTRDLLIVFLYSSFLSQLQALSLLLSIVLRAMVSTRRADYDGEDDYDGRARIREPLLNPQLSQASGSTKGDGRGIHSDIWSSRIRDKVFCLRVFISDEAFQNLKLHDHLCV